MVRSQGSFQTLPAEVSGQPGLPDPGRTLPYIPVTWLDFVQGRRSGPGGGRKEEKGAQVVLLINGKELFSGDR